MLIAEARISRPAIRLITWVGCWISSKRMTILNNKRLLDIFTFIFIRRAI